MYTDEFPCSSARDLELRHSSKSAVYTMLDVEMVDMGYHEHKPLLAEIWVGIHELDYLSRMLTLDGSTKIN